MSSPPSFKTSSLSHTSYLFPCSYPGILRTALHNKYFLIPPVEFSQGVKWLGEAESASLITDRKAQKDLGSNKCRANTPDMFDTLWPRMQKKTLRVRHWSSFHKYQKLEHSLITRDSSITTGWPGSLEDFNPHNPGLHDPVGSLVDLTKSPFYAFFCTWNIIRELGPQAPDPRHLAPLYTPVSGLD